MSPFTISLFISLILPLSIFIIASSISFNANSWREKSTPFECGFDPLKSARQPFSLQFFLLAVVFLIFDIEIVLLLPIPINIFNLTMSLMSLMFLIILILGLFHEWHEGTLNWKTPYPPSRQ